jgi:class 3 adenylate cyclase/tetratricopeptide (TPR) repeat protein
LVTSVLPGPWQWQRRCHPDTFTQVPICTQCATESPPGVRFCAACGAALPDADERRDVRKVVTVLFSDVTGSTALGETLEPERLRAVMREYFASMRAIIERHGGTVEKFIGDAVMAVFGVPQVHEDDALRAVRAAAEIRDGLPAVAEETGVSLWFRTGINTGMVLTGEGETLVVGDAVNVAGRLEQAAAPGEILLGQETWRLVRDAVEVEAIDPLPLKGKAELVPAYRLLRIDPTAEGWRRRLDTPLVGRRRELLMLTEAFERSVEEPSCHLFTLLGAAGAGKSRLVAELVTRTQDRALVLQGRCLPYGEGITFWPLVEALQAVGVPAVLDQGGTGTPEELFLAVRRHLERLAAERPVILVVDDLQWAEPMLVDLLDHVVDLSRGAPLLVITVARPELLEERPTWGGGKLNATTVLLAPLSAAESEALLGDGLEPDERARIVAAGGGNPLFLEELAALTREDGPSTVVPVTVQALLAARLERLPAAEREVLEHGSVEGEVFHHGAVRALAGGPVQPVLDALVRKDLVRPHPATLADDEAFRFRHLLIRDAAYDALPLRKRADLHERFADWLGEAGAGLLEVDEIAGSHLEQVVRYRRALELPVDPAVHTRGGGHLAAAGRRALARGDLQAGVNLLERALALLPDDDASWSAAAVNLVHPLLDVGRAEDADGLLTQIERGPASPMAVVARGTWLIRHRPDEGMPFLEERLPGIITELARGGDDAGLAQAYITGSMVHGTRSQARLAERELRKASEHARRAGARPLLGRSLASLVSTLVWGPAPVAEMRLRRAELGQEDAGPQLDALKYYLDSEIARMEGRFADARTAFAENVARLEALGIDPASRGFGGIPVVIEWDAEQLDACLALLSAADEHLARSDERGFRSTIVCQRALVHERLGNLAQAEADAALGLELGGPHDIANFGFAGPAQARVHARRGDLATAESIALHSVRSADTTDYPLPRGLARLGLAEVLWTAGRRDEAVEQAGHAVEIWTAKQHVGMLAYARAHLERYEAGGRGQRTTR